MSNNTHKIVAINQINKIECDTLYYFADGKSAAEYMKNRRGDIEEFFPADIYKLCVRKIESNAWHDREVERFRNGTYQRILWDTQEYIEEHGDWFRYYNADKYMFPHISRNNPQYISYTENPSKGREDIQARAISPEEYIKRFLPDVPAIDREYYVRQFAAAHCGDYVCISTNDADMIAWAYINGPSSCMAGEPSNNHQYMRSIEHPAVVYGKHSSFAVNGELALSLCFDRADVAGYDIDKDTTMIESDKGNAVIREMYHDWDTDEDYAGPRIYQSIST